MLHASCNCGGVSFRILEPLTAPSVCHCVQCRKQSGHVFASANVPKSAIRFLNAETLRWFQSSEKVRRGFCQRCGCWLFWEPLLKDWTSVALGAIDGDTGVTLERHIFVAEKGDYYDIADDLPQNPH